jgi:hypothetical protein
MMFPSIYYNPHIHLHLYCNLNRPSRALVHLLLLVDRELAWTAVDEEQETANNGEDLEEIVLRKVLVRVVFVELLPWLAPSLASTRTGFPTVQKLLTRRLKMLRITTRRVALNLALKPTTTMRQAMAPRIETRTLQIDQEPAKTKPTKRKMRRTRPANWKYIFRSFSSIEGSPAKALVFRTHESDKTMSRPPITERFRRKKLRSKIKPYPRAWVTTTPMRPKTA